ncbi:YkgJ family cysteine cluster protein [Roseateles chitinivorans]|uniref:YkgJ family cysteine cluster protein n=1 Tax=Roseateles chitinivorans TaxID=2917965 RepID=UPI003D671E3C
MTRPPIRFNCVGCGDCCRGRHGFMSLTLAETVAWLRRGQRVAVLLEAFPASGEQEAGPGLQLPVDYGVEVRSGGMGLRIAPVFGADLQAGCPNLADDNACRIYDDRPAVCRLYPAQTHPLSVFRMDTRACPPEAWNPPAGVILVEEDGRMPPGIQAMVEAFQGELGRDAAAKVAICEALGVHLAGWRGNGIVIHIPSVQDFLDAIAQAGARTEGPAPLSWALRVVGAELAAKLADADAQLYAGDGRAAHVFMPMATSSGDPRAS